MRICARAEQYRRQDTCFRALSKQPPLKKTGIFSCQRTTPLDTEGLLWALLIIENQNLKKKRKKREKEKERVTDIFISLCIHPELKRGDQLGAEKHGADETQLAFRKGNKTHTGDWQPAIKVLSDAWWTICTQFSRPWKWTSCLSEQWGTKA